MGVELESFEFNDSDQNSAGYKSRNQKAKEHENKGSKNVKSVDCMAEPKLEFYNSEIDLKNDCEAHVVGLVEPKSPSSKDKRGLDPSPYDIDSVACMTMPKLEFYDSMVDLKSDYESKVMNSIGPVSHSSNDIGSFMKFANDKQSVRKSFDSPSSDPLQADTFQSSVDVFVDQTVTKCEPEQVVSYDENSYHVVKDICVDKGVLTKHKFVFEETNDEKVYNFFPLESFDNNQKQNDDAGIKELNRPTTEESDHVMLKDGDEIEDLSNNVTNDDAKDYVPTDDKDEQHSGEPDFLSQSKDSNNMVEQAVLATPALGLAIDELNSDGTRSLAYHFGSSAPAGCVKNEFHQLEGCNCNETQLPFMTVKGSSNDFAEIHQSETTQNRCGLGESSFSAAGAVSGRISYSGSIPYSGSISIRSDSSTTSTRSFAFPILQSEWNSSPVRMEKPERSRYRKHRNWRNGLLCCKF